MPDRIINFCSKFVITTFPCYRCKYADTLHILFDTRYVGYLDQMLHVKLKPYGPNCSKLAFWWKTKCFKTIFDKNLTPFCNMFLQLKQWIFAVFICLSTLHVKNDFVCFCFFYFVVVCFLNQVSSSPKKPVRLYSVCKVCLKEEITVFTIFWHVYPQFVDIVLIRYILY